MICKMGIISMYLMRLSLKGLGVEHIYIVNARSVITIILFIIYPFNSHPLMYKSPIFLLRSCIMDHSDSRKNRIGPWSPILIQGGGGGCS